MRKAILTPALVLALASGLAACGPTDGAENVNAVTTANRAASSSAKTTTNPAGPPTSPAAANASASPAATAATTAATPPDHGHDPVVTADSPRRITLAEARAAFERNQAVFVDVRGDDAYRTGHIRGAVSIPTGSEAQHVDKLPKNKLIITYCA